jgi:hypothetical protein
MATLSSAASPFCRPEEDPFLLLESCDNTSGSILMGHAGRPLRRHWIDRPYGEEKISQLEEVVLPTIQYCLVRMDQIDDGCWPRAKTQILPELFTHRLPCLSPELTVVQRREELGFWARRDNYQSWQKPSLLHCTNPTKRRNDQ